MRTAAVIGAGPAGLMAAERLAAAGVAVTVYERMPSPARKLLMAGRGGLNLTHSEPRPGFDGRYGAAEPAAAGWLHGFGPADLIAWAEGLGQATFVGSSGRVFPRAMKASPLLRAWLGRLGGLGIELRTGWRWTGWREGALAFETVDGERVERADVTVLALGGASWPRLGSDGAWTPGLQAEGVAVEPFRPANAGVNIAWSDVLATRFAGQPVKPLALSIGGTSARGEAVLTSYGLEGGAVYALGEALDHASRAGPATLVMDLRPDLPVEALAQRLARPRRAGDSVSNHLRKAGGLSPIAIALLREIGDPPPGAEKLARRIKGLRFAVTGLQGLERAISSAGGVRLDGLDARMMLTARPGVFAAGEMLDWSAPTGGYLLQASMASGVAAAEGALAWLGVPVAAKPG